ncbi:MAG: hypothetical protein NVSMB63_16690 [Sediminibacterium sp.]
MIIDAVVAVLMVLAIVKGLHNGLVVAVFSFLGMIMGLAAAIKLSAVVAERLKESTQLEAAWLPFISFALILVVVFILVKLGARLIQTSLELAFLGWLNKLGGVLLYGALYTMVLSVLLFFAVNMHLVGQDTIAASKTYSYIQPWGPTAINALGSVIPFFKGMFAALSQFFEGIGKDIRQ